MADIPEGATVAIPNDPSNSGRALLLMAKNGLITLKDLNNISATQKDIAENPKKLKIRELEAATLPRVLNQVNLAVINTNYAIEAKLNPLKDSLFIEDASSPYANLLVAREDNANSPAIEEARRRAELARGEAVHRRQVPGRGGAGVLIGRGVSERRASATGSRLRRLR